jgi:hypothetical protein
VERTYTRTSRALANAALLVLLWVFWQFAEGQPMPVFVVFLLVIAPGIVFYGYFLSSQLCSRCREPVFDLSRHYILWRLAALAAPLHVPIRCPHCGAGTSW